MTKVLTTRMEEIKMSLGDDPMSRPVSKVKEPSSLSTSNPSLKRPSYALLNEVLAASVRRQSERK